MEFIVDVSLDISKTHLKALESCGDTAGSKDRHVDILCLIIRGTARIKRTTPCLHQVGGAHASQVLVHWCTHLIFHNFSLREVLRNCLMYISHLIISCIKYLYISKYIYSPMADVLHIQNTHGTRDWLAGGGHVTMKPHNFPRKKKRMKHMQKNPDDWKILTFGSFSHPLSPLIALSPPSLTSPSSCKLRWHFFPQEVEWTHLKPNQVRQMRFHTCILKGPIPFMTHSSLLTSSSRASRWRKFQKKKEPYSRERICL